MRGEKQNSALFSQVFPGALRVLRGERLRKKVGMMDKAKHKHSFVDNYDGMVAFGFSREVDEKSLMYYLQKFSDDNLLEAMVPKLTDEEISQIFEMLSQIMRRRLSDGEYHELFLKDPEPHGEGPR